MKVDPYGSSEHELKPLKSQSRHLLTEHLGESRILSMPGFLICTMETLTCHLPAGVVQGMMGKVMCGPGNEGLAECTLAGVSHLLLAAKDAHVSQS